MYVSHCSECTQGHQERQTQGSAREEEDAPEQERTFAAAVAESDGCLHSTKFGVDPSHSLSPLSADENLVGWGSGLSLVLGVGLDCWRE